MTNKRVLLISNSTLYGSGYLDHAAAEISDFLGALKRVLFVPFALYDRDAYAATATARFDRLGCALISIHKAQNRVKGVNVAEAFFMGGGNTFRLLKFFYVFTLLEPI